MRSLNSIARDSGLAVLATFGFIAVAGAVDFSSTSGSGATLPPIHSMASPDGSGPGAIAPTSIDQPRSVDGIGMALDSSALEGLRGGEDSEQVVDIQGRVSGNTADRIISGTNTISDGAFASASGINTVIQNSGSNVLIQNGMVVSVQFAGSAP